MGLQRWKRNQKKVSQNKHSMSERDKKAILLRALHKNHVWATDFCEDQLWNGKRFRIIAFLDIFTKEVLNHEVDFSITGDEVIIAFEEAMLKYGKPLSLRSDNGPEFMSKSLNRYLNYERIKHETIDKGKPFQNGFIESFFDKLRDECLNRHVFTTLIEAKEVISNYINNYNKERIHSSLNYRTAEEFAKECLCV